MGVYINGIEYDVHYGSNPVELDFLPYNIITNNEKIQSFDDYVLRDKNGVYLTMAKEEDNL